MPTTLTELGYEPLGMPAIEHIAEPPPPPKVLSEYINPRTRDLEQSETGELATMPVVRQKMLLALTTIKGTSTVLSNFGNTPPTKIDENYRRAMEDSVRLATAHITGAKEARIDSVTIETFGDTGTHPLVIVSYTDLTTGFADSLEIA